MGCRNQAKRFG